MCTTPTYSPITMTSLRSLCSCIPTYMFVHYKSLLQVSSDLFTQCKAPTIFVVGSEGTLTSVDYIEVSAYTILTIENL